MQDEPARNDSRSWLALVGFVLAAPCGFFASVVGVYFTGVLFGDRLDRALSSGAVGVALMVVLLAASVALAIAGYALLRARKPFTAGAMFGLACGVLAFAAIIALMATSTGHGVVS